MAEMVIKLIAGEARIRSPAPACETALNSVPSVCSVVESFFWRKIA